MKIGVLVYIGSEPYLLLIFLKIKITLAIKNERTTVVVLPL